MDKSQYFKVVYNKKACVNSIKNPDTLKYNTIRVLIIVHTLYYMLFAVAKTARPRAGRFTNRDFYNNNTSVFLKPTNVIISAIA